MSETIAATGVFNASPVDRVIHGKPFAEALAAESAARGAKSVFALVGGTLSRETDVVDQLKAALGSRFAGFTNKMAAHTPREDVVAAANAARDAGADLIATVGGGSVTDGGKMIALCLANDVTETAGLDRCYTRVHEDGRIEQPDLAEPTVRMICVPTTLSAGEFNYSAGCTDTGRRMKQAYRHPRHAPVAVILDPDVAKHTPAWLWLSTGMRAVDHAVEDLCSRRPHPFVDGTAMHALRMLGPGLARCKADAGDREARQMCQIGAWLSMTGVSAAVTKGASHGIGHVLGGTANVPHGYTSCVMLPNVLAYNVGVNVDQQARASEALGRPGDPAAEAVGDLISSLGLPRTLRDVGVKQDQLDTIARNAMHDRWVHTNPRPLKSWQDVRAILDLAW